MADVQYQRLTGWRRPRFLTLTPVSRSSVWLGPDHLLNINATYFREEYKRFYFRDIQAITIRKTSRRETWSAVLILLAVGGIATMVKVFPNPSNTGFIAAAIFVFGVLAALAINRALGPTCDVQIQTAVQTGVLPSFTRIPRTQRILESIRPLIGAEQGSIDPESMERRLREMAHSGATSPTVEPI